MLRIWLYIYRVFFSKQNVDMLQNVTLVYFRILEHIYSFFRRKRHSITKFLPIIHIVSIIAGRIYTLPNEPCKGSF